MKHLVYILPLIVLFSGCKKDDPPPKPVAAFSISYQANGAVVLLNNSKNATSYQWTLSDGRNSTAVSPRFEFGYNSDYNVTLTAKGDGGTDSATQTIQIRNLPTTGSVIFWSTYNRNITITVNGVNVGNTTVYYSGNVGPDCGTAGNVTVTLPAGIYNFTGKSNDIIPLNWNGQITVVNGECRKQLLYKS
ncbi:PKD domain-containing protein [Spirosoma sp. 48-14]|uniref:PKD domain-containing protein n=1 Tax=Spirosoma sp. 48-14 TaxID=1895854 RepID=UPI0009689647|nr:PKD domain-containing protein [Spirosoma sp. 48-14]OJW76287.1 MAG: hypothetical protein BGO59_22475 [Spirosoma sp. 48-14]